MSAIITITFSPCIDKSTSVPELIPEKKLKCTYPTLEPGGGGINVARVINRLGETATAIYPSGGYTGRFFDHLLQQEGIPSVVIETKNETRENIIVLEQCTSRQYRFGMPGTELNEREWKQCLEAIEKVKDVEFIVASGSLPPGVPLNIYAQIAVIARSKNAKLIVDTSGEALKCAVEEGVYLLKPNLGELSSLLGIKDMNMEKAVQAARDIVAKGKCEIVIVSMGAAGAMLVTKEDMYKVQPPPVNRKSTVGAGDSMVAGIVFSLLKKKTLKEALQYGVACGTAATMNPGTELCKPEDVIRLYTMLKKLS